MELCDPQWQLPPKHVTYSGPRPIDTYSHARDLVFEMKRHAEAEPLAREVLEIVATQGYQPFVLDWGKEAVSN